tara:strand:- start:3027 stop:3305 length:279 start_codon:yes stop_codon:yes gene_type:complete
MTITKKNISNNISNITGISSKDSVALLHAFNKLISKKSLLGYQIKIARFGVFTLKKTKKRTGRNPLTKKEYIISPMGKVTFKPSNIVKNKIN